MHPIKHESHRFPLVPVFGIGIGIAIAIAVAIGFCGYFEPQRPRRNALLVKAQRRSGTALGIGVIHSGSFAVFEVFVVMSSVVDL